MESKHRIFLKIYSFADMNKFSYFCYCQNLRLIVINPRFWQVCYGNDWKFIPGPCYEFPPPWGTPVTCPRCLSRLMRERVTGVDCWKTQTSIFTQQKLTIQIAETLENTTTWKITTMQNPVFTTNKIILPEPSAFSGGEMSKVSLPPLQGPARMPGRTGIGGLSKTAGNSNNEKYSNRVNNY